MTNPLERRRQLLELVKDIAQTQKLMRKRERSDMAFIDAWFEEDVYKQFYASDLGPISDAGDIPYESPIHEFLTEEEKLDRLVLPDPVFELRFSHRGRTIEIRSYNPDVHANLKGHMPEGTFVHDFSEKRKENDAYGLLVRLDGRTKFNRLDNFGGNENHLIFNVFYVMEDAVEGSIITLPVENGDAVSSLAGLRQLDLSNTSPKEYVSIGATPYLTMREQFHQCWEPGGEFLDEQVRPLFFKYKQRGEPVVQKLKAVLKDPY